MSEPIILTLAVAATRAADLLVTWRITPDLSREINPLIRLMGWRWTILLNLGLVAIIPFVSPYSAVGIMVFSLLAVIWSASTLL